MGKGVREGRRGDGLYLVSSRLVYLLLFTVCAVLCECFRFSCFCGVFKSPLIATGNFTATSNCITTTESKSESSNGIENAKELRAALDELWSGLKICRSDLLRCNSVGTKRDAIVLNYIFPNCKRKRFRIRSYQNLLSFFLANRIIRL